VLSVEVSDTRCSEGMYRRSVRCDVALSYHPSQFTRPTCLSLLAESLMRYGEKRWGYFGDGCCCRLVCFIGQPKSSEALF